MVYQIRLNVQNKTRTNRMKMKIKIDKDELYNLFIIKSKSRIDQSKYYNCSDANLKKMVKNI